MNSRKPTSFLVFFFGPLISSAFFLFASIVMFVLVQELFDRRGDWTSGITVALCTIGTGVAITAYLIGCRRIQKGWHQGLAICALVGLLLGSAHYVSHRMAAAVFIVVLMVAIGVWLTGVSAKAAVGRAFVPERSQIWLDDLVTSLPIPCEFILVSGWWVRAMHQGMPETSILFLGLLSAVAWYRVIGPILKILYCLVRVEADLVAVLLARSMPLIVLLRRTLFIAALAVAGTVISKVCGLPVVLIGLFGIAMALFLAIASMILSVLISRLRQFEPTALPYSEGMFLFAHLTLLMVGPGVLMVLTSMFVNKLMGLTIVLPAILFAGLSLPLALRKVEERQPKLRWIPVSNLRSRYAPDAPVSLLWGIRFIARCRCRAEAFRNFMSRSLARYIENRRRSRYQTRPLRQ